jgi:predicted SnoaL-like aldol condensation-catalyzing enzyme
LTSTSQGEFTNFGSELRSALTPTPQTRVREYINHVSAASTQGCEAAIASLTALQSNPAMTWDRLTLFTGDGYGLFYYRRYIPGSSEVDFAVMDKMRFRGTCLVEIWNVSQRIYGNETNPIAFF